MKMNCLQIKRGIFLLASTILLSLCIVGVTYSENFIPVNQQLDEPYTVEVSGIIVKRDLNNLFETSHLVAVCTITSQPTSFAVQCVDGGTAILNDRFAKVERIISGTSYDDIITIRLQGGTVGNRTEIYTANPVLEVGKQYLIFLNQPDMGGGFNTAGDYYYVSGLFQGVYEVTADNTFVSSTGTQLTADSFVVPVHVKENEPFSMRTEYLANQKINFENGMYTQEAYEAALAAVDQYAIILNDTKIE